DIRQVSGQILEQTQRVSQIVQTLVSYAHSGQNHQQRRGNIEVATPEPVDLHASIQEAISLLQLSHKNSQIEFRNLCPESHQVSGNRQKLQQVFINLLKNAADASDSGGTVTIHSSVSTHTVTVHFEDQGHGIPKAIQEKLFEPFFTTKEAGKGTGLGLALTWNIIEEHFGSIQVISPLDSKSHSGSDFIISLPRYEQEPLDITQYEEPHLEHQGNTA
ncbi:MAG: sensor histidine kinase, partial [Endozoicomonas sp.]